MELNALIAKMRIATRRSGHRARRARRKGSAGLTLIELLVAITILGAIGGALGGAFAVGIRALSPGGAQARLAGSHDLLAFEQQIGADVARADCLAAPGQSPIPTGGCTASVWPSKCGPSSGYLLCVGWYSPGSTTCHTVIYSYIQPPGSGKPVDERIVRTDLAGGASVQVTTNPLRVTQAAWALIPNSGYEWTNQVTVKVTQSKTLGAPAVNPATATFVLSPLAADPESPVLPPGSQSGSPAC
jgi:prepilin-type N-terminal cleavage/methylation domain-containing protein